MNVLRIGTYVVLLITQGAPLIEQIMRLAQFLLEFISIESPWGVAYISFLYSSFVALNKMHAQSFLVLIFALRITVSFPRFTVNFSCELCILRECY